jgi:hypothetical protein
MENCAVSPNFQFLESLDEQLLMPALQAERYLAEDPAVAIGKLRLFAERAAKIAAAHLGIYVEERGDFVETLRILSWHRSLLLPALPEQHEIVRRIDEVFAYAATLEGRVAETRAMVERLEPANLAKAFRGGLSEQVPEEAAAWEIALAEIERAAGELGREAKSSQGRRKPPPKSSSIANSRSFGNTGTKRLRGWPHNNS